MIKPPLPEPEIGRILAQAYTGDPGQRLRPEEARKARALSGILDEIARLLPARQGSAPILVDAAAGRGPVSLLVAAAWSEPIHLHAIERDAPRLAALREGFARVAHPAHRLETVAADVGDVAAWPARPRLVVALHACGDATDQVIARGIEVEMGTALLLPCCVANALPAAGRADRLADRLGYPRGAIRRRLRDLHTLTERVLTLEAAGYQTEVVAVCPESITPYNLALRARRVAEPVRARQAAARLARLREELGGVEGDANG
jgi:hypothetical protein